MVIADEPTTALDAAVAAQVLGVLRSITADGRGLLLITHDLAAARRVADEVIVLRDGAMVEQGPIGTVFARPMSPYTRQLLDAIPGAHTRRARVAAGQAEVERAPVLVADGIGKRYGGSDGIGRAALDGVGFALRAGETLGVIGASGSGKTTLARIVLGLLEPDAGQVTLDGAPWAGAGTARVRERARLRRRGALGFVPQDPLTSFDPRWPVGRILADALERAGVPRGERAPRIGALLGAVRLPASTAASWPRRLSGGQRQRVAIARAIAGRPRVIVCDEPVSALDVAVQGEVLDLLADLQAELGLACLFISHDLGVIRHVSDSVLVMNEGRIVESGSVEQVLGSPTDPFTLSLLQAADSSW